jgi:RNA polymerase sigma-70 factor (ECF subfamily)
MNTIHTADYSSQLDLDLAQASAQNDLLAFEELYRRHERRVYALCLRMLQNTDEANDLTQEVFVQVYRSIARYDAHDAFTTWLHRFTVNCVLAHFRSRTVKFEKTTDDDDGQPVKVISLNSEFKLPVIDHIAHQKAIDRLSNQYRRVFILHDLEGYSSEAVAKILGCSIGSVKASLHKARLKMRKLLNQVE